MKRSVPCSVGDQQHVASVMRRWRKGLVHLEYPRLCFLRVLSAGMLDDFGGDLRARRLLRRRWSHCGIRILGLSHYRNARPSTSRMCRHIVDGRAHSAADWAGGRQSAARWSARSCGAHVWKRSRRRRWRADLLGKERTAPPTQSHL
ncbi:hypothetical protein TcCL_ESM09310 [Trypanosoma cruzi]|nr:hypothetical protein TcCL_ESM09310 [Trypanosoma cruzi]